MIDFWKYIILQILCHEFQVGEITEHLSEQGSGNPDIL